jgi:pre-60S factor REI1
MERIHGMFIPEKQYLVDLDGLVGALQDRVINMNECLFCGKVKANTFAVQTHMRDTGHCKIPYTTEDEQLEIGEFYDFRSTYSDDEDSEDESMDDDGRENKRNGGAKLGAPRKTKITTAGDEPMSMTEDDEDGWETDSSESSLDSEDLHAVPAERHDHQYERLNKHPHHSRSADRGMHQKPDGYHSHAHKHTHTVFYDEYELHLPSGKSVGHRQHNRYFRQNLHSYPTPAERAERLAIEAAAAENAMDVDGDSRGNSRAVINRANGGLGLVGVSEHTKTNIRRAERRTRRKDIFESRRMEWKLNRQANHQKYYHYSIL